MPAMFDTRTIERSDRLAYWLDTVCDNILPVDIDPRHDPEPLAAMSSSHVGALAVREVVGGDHVYTRDPHHVRRDDPESFQLGVATRGASLLIQDGREAQLKPGDLVFWDSSRPYSLAMEGRFHWHVFLLPKHKLRRSDAELRRITAVPICPEAGEVSALAAHFLLDVATRARELKDDPVSASLGEVAGDLISTLVQAEFGLTWAVGQPDEVLMGRVRQFIADHHRDARLDPAAIAAGVGVSVRALHQLFSRTDETVMDAVRHTRLAAARRDLGDPRLASRSISGIAASHGVSNATVFTRAFQAAYGQAPREFRTAAATSSATSDQQRVEEPHA